MGFTGESAVALLETNVLSSNGNIGAESSLHGRQVDRRTSNHHLRVGGERTGLVQDINHTVDLGNGAVALPVSTDQCLCDLLRHFCW